MKIIISPHYDDGLLSCSSILEDKDILVTIFTKHDVNIYNKASNELKKYLNYPLREKENKLAGEFRNLKIINLGYREDYFRKCDNILKCKLKKDIIKIMNKYNLDMIYLPLAVGYHVDHLIVYNILKNLSTKKIYYLDYPYSCFQLATKTRLSDFGIFEDKLNINDIIKFSGNKIYPPIVRIYHTIINLCRYYLNNLYYHLFNRSVNYKIISNDTDILKKIKTIEFYSSQIKPIFGNNQNMTSHFHKYNKEHFITIKPNNNYNHKIKFIIYLLPYILIYYLFNYTIFNLLLLTLMVLFYFNLKIKPINKLISNNIFKKNLVSIYFIIPCYNEKDNIKKFIESLEYNSKVKYIIVDDCSTDNCMDIINDLDKSIHIVKSDVKNNIVSQVLNLGLKFVRENFKLNSNDYIGVLNVDSCLEKNAITKVISILENNVIDVLNFRNKSNNTSNYISRFSSDEKEFKYNLSKYGEVNLNNGYIIRSSMIDNFPNSWTEDLVLGNSIRGKKYQSNIIIYDNVPTGIKKLLLQKFRWIRGDIFYRISNTPKNIFDLVVNIYYLLPLYFIIGLYFHNVWLIFDMIFLINVESIIYFKFTNKIDISYSIKQQIINLLFYFHLILFPHEW